MAGDATMNGDTMAMRTRPNRTSLPLLALLLSAGAIADPHGSERSVSDEAPAVIEVVLAGDAGVPLIGDTLVGASRTEPGPARMLAEAVLPPGENEVRLEVPPGRYNVFCYSMGFGEVNHRDLRLAAGSSTTLACELPALVPAQGMVRSEETGLPIPGARVAYLHWELVLEDPERPITPVAREYWRRWASAETDRHGRYTFFLAPGHRTDLLVDAPGAAAVVLEGVTPPEDGGLLPEAVLPPGGDLEILLERPPGLDLPGNLSVQLDRLSHLGRRGDRRQRLWKRPVSEDGGVLFRSLPVGVYSGTVLAGDDTPYLPLGTIEVTPSGLATLREALASVTVEITVQGLQPEEEDEVVISLFSRLPAARARRLPRRDPDDAPRWEAEVRAAGFFGVVVEPANQWRVRWFDAGPWQVGAEVGRRSVVAVAPDRVIGGRVVDSGGQPVADAYVVLSSLGAVRECGVLTDSLGRFSCRWAADRRLIAWARHDHHGISDVIRVPAGSGDLGDLVLYPGRAVSGKVEGANGPVAGARLAFGSEKYPHLDIRATTGDDGRFDLTQLPAVPGVLVGRAIEYTGTAFFAQPMSASAHGDAMSLRVEQAGTAVALGPATGWSAAGGQPARLVYEGLELNPWLLSAGARAGGIVSNPGMPVVFSALPPGRYHLRWRDADGEVVAESAPFVVRPGEVTVFSSRAR